MNKVVIVINGKGGVGKDTLCSLAEKHFGVKNISSITPIKEIAKQNGWTGLKDKKSRKFLSGLKNLFIEFNNLPMNYLKQEYEDFKQDDKQVLFVHIREPEEIDKFVKEIKYDSKDIRVITMLVRRKTLADEIYNNKADDEVENYEYDYIFNNDYDLLKAETDIKDLLTHILAGF